MSAQQDNSGAASGVLPMAAVGHATPRIDAIERVTGRAKYTGDIQLPGMLFAKILRSPYAHASIKSIDVSKARALQGVKAVLTHVNCRIWWGAGSVNGGQQYSDDVKIRTNQRRYVFNNPVRFVGEPIAAVAAVNRHIAEEALQLIAVDYEVLPHVLDQEEALKPDAPKIWPEGNLALDQRGAAQPIEEHRGNVVEALNSSAHVFEGRFSTAFVHNAQMEPRACVAYWEHEKLTVYTPTGGIANCRHDIARDLGMPDDTVRVIAHYMGGNFGNKNQNQDADLITAMLSKETLAPVKLEFSRKDDFIGMHGRWPTTHYYTVGTNDDGSLNAIQLRGYSGIGGYRKNSGAIAGVELYKCANVQSIVTPVYTNKTVSGNFRAPAYPQGFFGIQSMMDDIAHKLKIDPVEFALKNMSRMARDEVPYTNYTLDECIRRGAEVFDWKARWRSQPGSDEGPIKRGAGFTYMVFRSGVGSSSAIIHVDSKARYTVFVGVTDVGAGAKTTMGLIAADTLGVPLSQVEVVWGDTDKCPYSVGESGSRTTTMTGYAVMQAAHDLKRQITEKGLPTGSDTLVASVTPTPRIDGRVRSVFGAHFVEAEVDTELGTVRITKYVAVHEGGRVINPLTATGQIAGAAIQGIGQALHENLLYDTRSGQPLTAGFYYDRIPTHQDAPQIEVVFIESDDGHGPYGAKSMGESGIVLAPGAVANAVFNAIAKRINDLPITRDRILGALG